MSELSTYLVVFRHHRCFGSDMRVLRGLGCYMLGTFTTDKEIRYCTVAASGSLSITISTLPLVCRFSPLGISWPSSYLLAICA